MPFNQNFGMGTGSDRQSIVILDLGPKRPTLPNQQRPAVPDSGLVGTAKVEAWTNYENETAIYERGRHDYMAAKREYESWHAANPTFPAKKTVPLIDGKEAVHNDPERYQFHFPEPAAAVEAA